MAGGAAEGDRALQAVLANVHAYYAQFLPAVQQAVTDGLAPIEKRLKVGIGMLCGAWGLTAGQVNGHGAQCATNTGLRVSFAIF